MKYIALDLELNQPSGKIIQIGWAIGTLDGNEEPTKNAVYVNPGEPISEFITKLTGINDGHVQDAAHLSEAFIKLRNEFGDANLLRIPIAWGGGDMSCLKSQLGVQSVDMMLQGEETPKAVWPFARSEWDIKKLWQFYRLANGHSIQGGLAKSMTKMGLNFKGRKHDAADDAFNTLLVARHLFKLLKSK